MGSKLLVLNSVLLALLVVGVGAVVFLLAFPDTFEERVSARVVARQVEELLAEDVRGGTFASAELESCIRREPREFLCLVYARDAERNRRVTFTYDVVCSSKATCIYSTRNVGFRDS